MTRSILQQNINANFIAYELSVKIVDTFGVVLIVTNGPYILLCILLNCRIVVLSNTNILGLERTSSDKAYIFPS